MKRQGQILASVLHLLNYINYINYNVEARHSHDNQFLCSIEVGAFALRLRWDSQSSVRGDFGIICQNPSVSKSNWLHITIFPFFFISLKYIVRDSF